MTIQGPHPPNIDVPRLLRQLRRSKVWTAWIGLREVPLGTTDEMEARRRLDALIEEERRKETVCLGQREGATRKVPYRVYKEAGRFIVKYYDRQGVRRKHRIPPDLPIPIESLEAALAYAEQWYGEQIRQNVRRQIEPPESPLTIDGIGPALTFEEFGRLWTAGKLAQWFPDHVKKKISAVDDARRFRRYVYPHIGREPVRSFEGRRGIELVERVVSGLPPAGATFSSSSRRQVLQGIHRLLTLAVYPAKLLVTNPLPRGFVPKGACEKAKSYLYPDEEAKLMAFCDLPVEERLFYGILAREGLRVSELRGLRWADVDLNRGVLTLDQNKTDEPRAWAMSPDVVEALRHWKRICTERGVTSRSILVNARGRPIDRLALAKKLRESLLRAGVTRPQLFEANESRIPLRAHDLRASFVTVNLALGKSEAWITDRTGHKSSQMVALYKRAARTHTELNLGPFRPLDESIPELRKQEGGAARARGNPSIESRASE